MIASAAGSALSTIAYSGLIKDKTAQGILGGVGGIASAIGTGMMIGSSTGSVAAGAIIGTLSAIPSILEAIGVLTTSTSEKIENLNSKIEETNNARLKSKDELKTLADYKRRYDELNKS